ncbi:MAG TPA: hypothetical protein VGI75_09070 [Pirellulales bacterium]|jgi:hypothetical protein
MGILTDFFIADSSQLGKIFIGWHCVLEEPIRRQAKNSFTNSSQEITEWQLGALITEGTATCINFQRLR